jgi:hypothetical protein
MINEQQGKRSLNLTKNNEIRESWFEKNPKKTMFFILLILISGLIYSAEKYLEKKIRKKSLYGVNRNSADT